MTLKELHAFYAAATCNSFSTAAARLHISQSTLSKRIATLEDYLQCSLFNRVGYKATLTTLGHELLPKVEKLFELNDQILSISESGRLFDIKCRFGVGEIAASSWLAEFITCATSKYPKLILEPEVRMGHELRKRVLDGHLDFAVVANEPHDMSLAAERIAEVEFQWVMSAQLNEADNSFSHIIKTKSIITMDSHAGASNVLTSWLKGNGYSNKNLIICNNMSAIAGLVGADIGISYLPTGWVAPLIEKRILNVIPNAEKLDNLGYYFCHRSDDKRYMISMMKQLIKSSVDYKKSMLAM